MTLWRAFLDGGLADKLNLLLFLVGLPLAIAAIAKARGPSGRVLGAAATFAGLAILLVGTLGWYTGRARTNGAVSGASVNPGMRDRIRREGYMESNCAIDFGLGFAAIPLVLGGIAVVISRRRERHGVGLPELTLGVAGLIVVTDVGALTLPLPGRDLPTGDPDWHVVDAYYMISTCLAPDGHCGPTEWAHSCSSLDAALHPAAGETFYGVAQTPPDLTKVPDIDVPKLLDACRAHAAAPARR